MYQIQKFLSDEVGFITSVLLIAAVIVYCVSVSFIKRFDKWDWFVIYFGLGGVVATLFMPVYFSQLPSLTDIFSYPTRVIALTFFPPFGWLNLFGVLICTVLRNRKKSLGYKAGIGLIVIGTFLSIFLIYVWAVD